MLKCFLCQTTFRPKESNMKSLTSSCPSCNASFLTKFAGFSNQCLVMLSDQNWYTATTPVSTLNLLTISIYENFYSFPVFQIHPIQATYLFSIVLNPWIYYNVHYSFYVGHSKFIWLARSKVKTKRGRQNPSPYHRILNLYRSRYEDD